MKKVVFIFLSLLTCAFANKDTILNPGNIHILLEKNASEALLEINGPYYVFNPQDGSKISSGILSKRFIVRSTPNGIKWGQEFPGANQMVVIPRSKGTTFLINGIQYEGSIAIYKTQDKFNLVNQIDVESYLKSILTTQFYYPIEQEAMAAIAIAARTTAYFQIEKNKDNPWHIDNAKYQGSALIVPNSLIVNAVDSTKNLILLNEKKLPFYASWNEHCGGKTASFNSIFRKDFNTPPGVEVSVAALDRKETRWSYCVPISKLASFLSLNTINSIDLFQDTYSNKVYALRFKEFDKHKDIDFITLQQKIGSENLKSNDFSIYIRENEVHFIGYGKGLGVGICLYSASLMAQNGDIAINILSKFYPNTFIANLSSHQKN